MRVGNFSVQIPEGRERDSGHVSLDHDRQYVIRLGNHYYDKRCDASVMVDGKDVGCFRLNAGCTMVLERPSHDTGKFTFFKADSVQADVAGVAYIGTEQRGLVQVTFRVERKREVEKEIKTSGILRSSRAGGSSARGMSSFGSNEGQFQNSVTPGITGLTGQSNQSFTSVTALDYDPSGEVVITLRLVADKFAVRELTPAQRSNPVPASV